VRDDLDKKLVEAFPKLYSKRGGSMQETCMYWGFECGDGWFQLLWDASEKLEALNNAGQNIKASQVKEKFGTLRFYINGGDEKADEIISAAEDRSAVTCEGCGEPGKLRGKYWLYTACDAHARKEDK
jgi:hypothetical protein